MNQRKRTIIATVLSLIVIAATAAGVGFKGFTPLPTFPVADSQTDPSLNGSLAITRTNDSDSGSQSCVDIMNVATRKSRQIFCGHGYNMSVVWLSNGTLFISEPPDFGVLSGTEPAQPIDPHEQAPARTHVFDIDGRRLPNLSADETKKAAEAASGRYSSSLDFTADWDGAGVVKNRFDSVVSVEGPPEYRFEQVEVSPRSDFLAITDTEGQVLVTRIDKPKLHLLTRIGHEGADWYVTDLSWYQPGRVENTVAQPPDPTSGVLSSFQINPN